MTDLDAFIGAWETEATHPAFPGVVVPDVPADVPDVPADVPDGDEPGSDPGVPAPQPDPDIPGFPDFGPGWPFADGPPG